mgnify:FL=1
MDVMRFKWNDFALLGIMVMDTGIRGNNDIGRYDIYRIETADYKHTELYLPYHLMEITEPARRASRIDIDIELEDRTYLGDFGECFNLIVWNIWGDVFV